MLFNRTAFLTIIFSITATITFSQKRKTHFPVWVFQQKNVIIDGVSFGLWNFSSWQRNTTTNGIRLSLIGEGILAPFLSKNPVPENDSSYKNFKDTLKIGTSSGDTLFSERINGINLSGTGSMGSYAVNGITAGLIGQINGKINGISVAAVLNFAPFHNGIQGALFLNYCIEMNGIQCAAMNDTYKMNGLQIGLFNKSKRTRGIQIGLWNVNEHRKFPLINWSFH